MNIIAISPKSGMEQAEIIDTFWTYQAATTTSRHVCKFVQLNSMNTMACEYNQQQEDMFMKLLMVGTWS